MKTKILLLSLSVAAFSSCSTAYKSGQTPDDVYYSPVRVSEDETDNRREEKKYEPARDYEITMGIRDYRWRNFGDDYDYDYSPYNYACNNYHYGYYYNPRYYPWAIYTGKTSYTKAINTTPRMVNLNAYNGYNPNVANLKTNSSSWINPATRYNNTNSTSRDRSRTILFPSSNTNSNSGSSNNTRTYTPSTSSGSSSSSSGNSSSGTVSRPGRGG